MPAELAVLMVGVAARQASSPTAMIATHPRRARTETSLLAASNGAFNDVVAHKITHWGGPQWERS